jgi:UDP-N-acetylenolpyruvoylglucosamine reductase
LILINKNREATYKDVVDLSGLIVRKVEEKYGVILEREVNMI